MDLDAKAADIRHLYENRIITMKEARAMLDHLDNLAVLDALEKPIYIPPPRIT